MKDGVHCTDIRTPSSCPRQRRSRAPRPSSLLCWHKHTNSMFAASFRAQQVSSVQALQPVSKMPWFHECECRVNVRSAGVARHTAHSHRISRWCLVGPTLTKEVGERRTEGAQWYAWMAITGGGGDKTKARDGTVCAWLD